MRCRFHKYAYCQLKRALRLLPATLTAAAFLCVSIAVFAAVVMADHGAKAENNNFDVAYVGDLSDYMGFNVDKMAMTIGEQFGVGFHKMTEEQAELAMLLGEISTYVIFPQGFVEAVDSGYNDKRVIYVTAEGTGGIAGRLLSESLDGVSSIMTTTQGTYYSAYDFMRLIAYSDSFSGAGETLDKGMIRSVLATIGAADVELLGVSNGLSFKGYYLAAVLMIFITLSGTGCACFFSGRNREFELSIKREGQNAALQAASEFIGFAALQTVSLIFLGIIMCIMVSTGLFTVSELGIDPGRNAALFVISVWPYAIMLFMMQFMLYEMFRGTIGAVMTQFAIAVILGLISGYYYPLSMLPEKVTAFSSFLPTGVAMNAASHILLHDKGIKEPLLCALWAVAFYGISVLIRNRRLEKDL